MLACPLAIVCTSARLSVIEFDIDAKKVDALNRCIDPIKHVSNGRVSAASGHGPEGVPSHEAQDSRRSTGREQEEQPIAKR